MYYITKKFSHVCDKKKYDDTDSFFPLKSKKQTAGDASYLSSPPPPRTHGRLCMNIDIVICYHTNVFVTACLTQVIYLCSDMYYDIVGYILLLLCGWSSVLYSY